MFRVEHIFLSPGHNFFGHHDQAPGQHPMLPVPAAECVAGRGLRGDRFFDFKPDYKGQITFFAVEVHDELCATLRDPLFDSDLPLPEPSVYRRNIITRGIDLNTLIGREFTVQGVTFLGTAECSPCYWMNSAFGPGAESALRGRGGLRARILTDGVLRADPANAVSDA